MTLEEILGNEALRQQEFPVTKGSAFLAHAGVCPLPRRVAQAVQDYTNRCTTGDQEAVLEDYSLPKTRELAAGLLKAKPEEIALVGPTSIGLSLIANGLQLKRGDNIVIYFDDYPSNVYPWMPLADRGIEVRFLNARELGRIRTIDVIGQVDERTRLVALASCHFLSGFRIDLNAIGEGLRKRNIWFCVDGIQTLGAFPTTVENIDFLAADAHKWMLGPCAAGILYVRKSLQDYIRPTLYGWHNVRCPNYVAQEEMTFRSDARRYEAGSGNIVGNLGMHAALELLTEVGIDNIAKELHRKRAWLVEALTAKGYTVLQAKVAEANSGGITTFHKPETDMGAIHQRLQEAGVTTSLRTDRGGQRYIRVSPHFYNTDAELQRLLEALP
ncbi:MAG TPA: aminotransferase class V-fold PLP-dependent enzyme [Roseimicrobium sp.]|nr:aminotransferase class V-fold PLP-dependent enzyme [Roseimicrobium sp.]